MIDQPPPAFAPPDEKAWEGMHHAFVQAAEESRKALPYRGLLTMEEDVRHGHVREFVLRWHELASQEDAAVPGFLTLLVEAQTGNIGDPTLRAAYREFVVILLDTLYNEQDELEDCQGELQETRGKLTEARREQAEIRGAVAAIAGDVATITSSITELRTAVARNSAEGAR
jgi:hypothetical protein